MRVKQRCHAVMDWCLAQKFISGNPTTVVSKLLPVMEKKNVRTEHQPSMPWQDLPAFVTTVLHDGTPGTCREAMEFLILSAARSGEVRKMQWCEIDLERKVWTVPAENMKAKIAHRVPLSPRMIEILDRQSSLGLHNKLAFPSPEGRCSLITRFPNFSGIRKCHATRKVGLLLFMVSDRAFGFGGHKRAIQRICSSSVWLIPSETLLWRRT